MNTSGFILLHRKLLNSPLWTQLPESWLKVWIAILLRANYQPSQWWDGARMVDLPAGSFATSLGKLAEFAHVGVQQVRGALKFLKVTGSITHTVTSRYSIITVLNWDTYQGFSDTGNRPINTSDNARATQSQQADNTVATTEEQFLTSKNNILSRANGAPGGEPSRVSSQTRKINEKSELDLAVESIAAEIYGRHPKPRRDIGIGAIAKSLRTICAKGTQEQKLEQLSGINRRHAGWCESPMWTKDGGEFAKGLENWLAPTKGRFNAEPPKPQGNSSSGTKYERVA